MKDESLIERHKDSKTERKERWREREIDGNGVGGVSGGGGGS